VRRIRGPRVVCTRQESYAAKNNGWPGGEVEKPIWAGFPQRKVMLAESRESECQQCLGKTDSVRPEETKFESTPTSKIFWAESEARGERWRKGEVSDEIVFELLGKLSQVREKTVTLSKFLKKANCGKRIANIAESALRLDIPENDGVVFEGSRQSRLESEQVD